MKTKCDKKCKHAYTDTESSDGGWPHEVKVKEDKGEIHTDDCGFFICENGGDCGVKGMHDPEIHCTSGDPGVACRVRKPNKKPKDLKWMHAFIERQLADHRRILEENLKLLKICINDPSLFVHAVWVDDVMENLPICRDRIRHLEQLLRVAEGAVQ